MQQLAVVEEVEHAQCGADHGSDVEDLSDQDPGSDGDMEEGDNAADVVDGVAGARGVQEVQRDTSVSLLSTTMSIEPSNVTAGGGCGAAAVQLSAAAAAVAAADNEPLGHGAGKDKSSDIPDFSGEFEQCSTDSDSEDISDSHGDSGSSKENKVRLTHVRPSSARVLEWQPYFFEKAFVRWFPWGRGGPSDDRRTHVSLPKCLEHYLRLHHHPKFKEGPFVLAGYNVTAKRAAASAAFVSCKFGAKGDAYATLTAAQLQAAAVHKQQCMSAAKRNAPHPPMPAILAGNPVAKAFLRSVEYVTKAMPHSHARTLEARKEAHSYCYEFGKPTWFVTINKNDGRCPEIVFLCMQKHTGGTPSKAFRYDLLGRFPGAAALSFDRLVRLFITHLLAWDTKKGRPHLDEKGQRMKGIFGETLAFFGPFEEQGRLSLHVHLLIWIRNMSQMRRRMLHPDALSRMANLIDSAISTSTWLPHCALKLAMRCPHCKKEACWQHVDDWEKYRQARQGCHRRMNQARSVVCQKCKKTSVPKKRIEDALNMAWKGLLSTAADGTASGRVAAIDRLFRDAIATQDVANSKTSGRGGQSLDRARSTCADGNSRSTDGTVESKGEDPGSTPSTSVMPAMVDTCVLVLCVGVSRGCWWWLQ